MTKEGKMIMEDRQPEIPLRPQDGLPQPARPAGAPENEPYLPQGPALLYVYSDARASLNPAERTVVQADLAVPIGGGPMSLAEARRERQILRGLLEHALWLLDRYDAGEL